MDRSFALLATAVLTLAGGLAQGQVTVSIDEAPTRIGAGAEIEIAWTIQAPSPVLTAVIWGDSSRGWTEVTQVHQGQPGTFRARFQAPSAPQTLYWTVYVRTDSVEGVIPERTIAVESAPFGISVRVAPDLRFPGTEPPPPPGSLTAVPVFTSLTFNRPVFLTSAPDGSDRIFVVEQAGRIRVFQNSEGVSQANTFLDIRSRVRGFSEEGLLGLAFPPNYTSSRVFYVYYTPDSSPRRSVVARYRTSSSNPNQALESSEEILLTIAQPYANHNGGMLTFGPDGFLYLGLGDGGSGGDPQGNGQDRGSLLGSVLRIDPHQSGSGYDVPPDNPFVSTPGSRGEIWAYGLRNPWRFSFDRLTGELWLGDVGQDAREEIDVIVRGGNYGWRVFEGERSFQNPQGLPASQFLGPVVDYSHSLGRSVIGGYVYRGDRYPSLRGVYLYGDYVSGRIWGLKRDSNGQVVWNEQITEVPNLSSFGEDAQGELYALSHISGRIYQFRFPGAGGLPFPSRLRDTGLFQDLSTLSPAPGVIEYEVNSPLWSDGAIKRRWIALPDATSHIGFRPDEPWTFPVGAVLVKHFELELEPGNALSRQRLETRVLVHQPNGWAGYTYKWNDQNTAASLLSSGASETYQVLDPSAPGGVRSQLWSFPSRAECMSCHNSAAGFVLGVRGEQLNREFVYPSLSDNQLRAWNHIGLFDSDIGDPAQYPAYPDPSDQGAPLEARARSYLAVNCGQCHLPGGPTPRAIDLRFHTADADMQAIDEVPLGSTLQLPDARIVAPGTKERSVLWERMTRQDFRRMPLLGSAELDPTGIELIGRWIDTLTP